MASRILAVVALLLALPAGGIASGGAAEPCAGVLCAGAASVDMTWHTGAGQGQLGGSGNHLTADRFDPYHHNTKMVPTDGIQSRTFAKAVVVQGADGRKVAYVKTELYLQQDLMTRRVAELVTAEVAGLDATGIMLGGTHNHSAPHYTSTAWGVWLFADAFDFRAFEHTARRIALAVVEADARLQPARTGAAVTRLRDVQQNILGPAVADDGSPAGFPRDHFDDELAVVRFDAVPSGEPIAAIVNFGMHPESIGGNANLISADFVGVVERDVERALGRVPAGDDGPVVAWSQGGLGDVEPDQSRAAPAAAGREYWRRDFAQAERMSAAITAAVLRAWDAVASGGTDVPEKHVPLSSDAVVDARSYRFPGPKGHPYPSVSNCRTDRPGVPVVGLPDCARPANPPDGYGATIRLLREAGIPVPDNYSVPSYTGVQEGLTVHLQVLRIGDVLLAGCPCEPVTDMTVNFKTRTDRVEGNQHLGYEWPCREGLETEVECDFRHTAWQAPDWRPVDPDAYARMRAHVRNDAAGWEDDLGQVLGEAEPTDPAQILGNFTHAELDAEAGFVLPLMVGKANDYVGYVVTYREYQRGDHYRKALTPFGPRTADYINTRLVAMAAELRGGPPPRDRLETVAATADGAKQTAKTAALGAAAEVGTTAYEAALPDDGGQPGLVVAQPDPVLERFGAATLVWEGGSNYTDNPTVVVERESADGWETVATQEGGEVVVTLDYGSWRSDAPLRWLQGGYAYRWTATFEVFDATAPGVYRLAVAGHHRSAGGATPYEFTSEAFEVVPWTGIAVTDLRVDGDAASFVVTGAREEPWVGPIDPLPGDEVRYPHRYDSTVPFVGGGYTERGPYRYCFRCTFRPWATHGRVVEAWVSVDHADGATTRHPAAFDGQRWVAPGLGLADGDVVRVAPGDVLDEFGNTNGGNA